MHTAVLLGIGLLAAGTGDYSRPLGGSKLDQAAFDAETFGLKKAIAREDDGLRVVLPAGEAETGWKTPQNLRLGGDFAIKATFLLKKLPKPAQEDGAAVGLAVGTQNVDQPDATLIRLIEPAESADVYRAINQAKNPQPSPDGNMNMMMMGMGMQPGGKPAKPPRPVFPARGETFQLILKREGPNLRYYVQDDLARDGKPRYLGQVNLGPGDVAGVKLFVSNRNGAEAVDVLLRDLDVTADRISGLGTAVRTVFGGVIHGDPTAIEDGKLVVGGPPPGGAPGGAAPDAPPGAAPASPAQPADAPPGAVVAPAPAAAPAVAVAPAAGGAVAKVAVAPAAVTQKAQEPTPPPAQGDAPKADAPKPTPPEPKARIPLDEVESVTFDRAVNLAARFLGQPNLDLTGPGGDAAATDAKAADSKPADAKAADTKAADAKPPDKADDVTAPPPGTVAPPKTPKVEPKPNGIRDLHLALAGLRNAAIKQIQINGQTDKGQASWRLDTSGSKDAPILLRRAGTEPWAELFLEPPEGDCHEKQFTVNITYADNQNANTQVKVSEHTDSKLAVDADAPPPPVDARLYLTGDEQLFGQIEALGADTLKLRTPWGDRLDVPLARVVAIYMGMPDHKESPESFARRLKARGTDDLLLARAKDGEVVAIAGIVEKIDGDKLAFQFQEKTRTLPLKQVEGLVLAARPEPKRPDDLRGTFTLAGGIVVSGRWTGLDAKAWKVETDWGQTLELPAAEVTGVRFRGGQATYLSDLAPGQAEETPYFGRRLPWRRDVNLLGEPLKMAGKAYARGLAVHSRTALTYDLDGRFATFEALVGFDDATKGKGRVDCRVLADGKELYANPDLRADAPPVPLSLKVAGAKQLQLVVDFGEDQDTGDRVIWADARLYRRPPPAEAEKPKPDIKK